MRVLITGAVGYLGSKVVEKFRSKGHMVCTLDAGWFSFPHKATVDLQKLVSQLSHSELKPFDVVIHLAWFSSAGNELKELQQFSLDQTKKLVDLALQCQAKFIFASTASVYGFQEGLCCERTEPNPVCAYGEAKLRAEEYIHHMFDGSSQYRITRKGTLMGAGLGRTRTDIVVNAMYISAVKDKIIYVWDPETVRPLYHINDAVEAYYQLATSEDWGPTDTTFNLAHKNYQMLSLAHWIAELLPFSIEVKARWDKLDGSERSYSLDCRLADVYDLPRGLGVKAAVEGLWGRGFKLNSETYKNISWMEKLLEFSGWLKNIPLPKV